MTNCTCHRQNIYQQAVDLKSKTASKMGLFGNSRGINIWDMQAMANHRQVPQTKENSIILWRRRKVGGAVVNESKVLWREARVWGDDSFSMADC